jgi:hypothetical protein
VGWPGLVRDHGPAHIKVALNLSPLQFPTDNPVCGGEEGARSDWPPPKRVEARNHRDTVVGEGRSRARNIARAARVQSGRSDG